MLQSYTVYRCGYGVFGQEFGCQAVILVVSASRLSVLEVGTVKQAHVCSLALNAHYHNVPLAWVSQVPLVESRISHSLENLLFRYQHGSVTPDDTQVEL